jgi:hypothetical protein
MWFCTDNQWHSDAELEKHFKKKCFDGQVIPDGVTDDDRYSIFYEAQWKADTLPKAAADYLRSLRFVKGLKKTGDKK